MPDASTPSRREFLGAISVPVAAGAAAALLDPFRARQASVRLAMHDIAESAGRGPDPDENFWFDASQAFTIDRSILNLNNGGVSPAPVSVQRAMQRHVDYCNTVPPPVALWQTLDPQVEIVRERLARAFGADKEEIAITRNSTESLQTCQLGFDLKPGDEVLTSTQDYPRMMSAFRQRERREGVVLKTVTIPVPCEDPALAIRAFEEGISPRTKMVLVSHIINLTGQILPIRDIVAMVARKAPGVPVIVDGAHAIANLPFRLSDLGCDYYGSSLHKWLFAPIGCGLLYIRRSKIKGLWPLLPGEASLEDDIRKFEQVGTHPAAPYVAIADALTFHEALGPERKFRRLMFLRDSWVGRLRQGSHKDRVRVHSPAAPGTCCGIATVQFEGLDTAKLQSHLWSTRRILTVAIKHEQFEGLRVSPSVYTLREDLDRFCDALEEAMERGLPA